jgi:selenide,water dikinase
MHDQIPLTRDLVLIGGGHTHALVLRMWGMNPLPGVRLTVINPAPTAPYSGMLPGFVAGHYSKDDLDIDLIKLARFAGARVIVDKATGIDLRARTISLKGRGPIPYDIASIDVGITSEMPDLAGFVEHGIPAKPLDTFAARWDAYRKEAKKPRVAVLGGGVAGAELSMAMAHALRGKSAEVRLIDRGTALSEFNETARDQLVKSLKDARVELIENADVVEVTADAVVLKDGTRIPSTFTNGATGARPHSWIADTGLKLYQGFISVGPTLQSSDSHVFAAGDCAYLTHAPRPKAGVFAVREAPVLFHNLRAALSGGTFKGYQPQKDYLKLISLGQKSALAEKLGTAVRGPMLWAWKNRIDTKFMEKFHNLPTMAQPKLPALVADGVRAVMGDVPMCAGCGSKVGRSALRAALADLPNSDRDDVRYVKGDDAAVIEVSGETLVMTTDHLRAFTHDPDLMTRIAANHALGDVWAMGAEPQAATMSVILPRMSPELQQRTMAEITTAAADVMGRAGAVIAGGHTSVGSEFTIGFTITGRTAGEVRTIEGAKEGDILVLTKPLGTGVLLAAEMRGLASGRDVVAAYRRMAEPQAVASRILGSEARAMTDVTGFGLAGHLSGMCEASGVGAEITLANLPVLRGVEALISAGVKSTLWDENREGAGGVFGAQGPRFDLLFDPQTSGGLLAAVRADLADELVRKLWLCGYGAAAIGRITDTPAIKVI